MDHVRPTIGRIVLYRGKNMQTRPAIITHVHETYYINVYVFGKDSDDDEHGIQTLIPHEDTVQNPNSFFSWHWPNRGP